MFQYFSNKVCVCDVFQKYAQLDRRIFMVIVWIVGMDTIRELQDKLSVATANLDVPHMSLMQQVKANVMVCTSFCISKRNVSQFTKPR